MPKVWSYLYTTAKSPKLEETSDVSAEEASDHDTDEELDDDIAPMAGFGCGLPLSRNYATYVGGRLELNSLPPFGTDAYLYLNRLGDAEEKVIDVADRALYLGVDCNTNFLT